MIHLWIAYLLLFLFFFPSSGFSQTWEDQGLYGGQIQTLAADPSDGNCLFAGSWEGDGLFKTTNGGATWGSIEGFRNEDLRSIAIDPNDHLTIWVATISFISQSTDGGKTWTQYDPARKGRVWRNYYSVTVDPLQQDVVYVGCSGLYGSGDGGVIFRTTDSGRSWEQLALKADHVPWAIAVNPGNRQEVWLVTDTFSSEDGSIYRSADGGLSWVTVETGLTPGWFEEIVINPLHPKTVYVGGENGVYRTKDGGKTWKQLLPDSWCEALILDPHNPETVYAAWNLNFSKSTDGGNTWITYDLSTGFFPLEFFTLAINPQDPDVIYGGDSNLGVFKSEDGGATWIPVNQGIKANAVSCSAVGSGGEIYSGTIAGLYRGGGNGIWTCLNPRNTFSFALDPSNPDILYAGFNWRLEKSTDGGLNWEEILSPSRLDPCRIEAIAVSKANTQLIYAGVFYYSGREGAIYKSTDGGESWKKVMKTSRPVNVIEIDPLNPSLLYAGSGHLVEPTLPGNLYKSVDRGETWNLTGLQQKVVDAIALDPNNSEILYTGTFAPEDSSAVGLYKSMDGGITWEEKGRGLPPGTTVTALKIDASSSQILYVATLHDGIYITFNGGDYWTLLGLSDYHSYDLLIPFLPQRILSSSLSAFFFPVSLYAGTGSGFLQFTASGVGMIEGMVMDCLSEQGITGAEVTTDTGGMALSLDGYYLIMAPAGICTVSAATDCYQSTHVERVVVNEFEVAPVDLCIFPQDGIFGKITSKGKAIKGATLILSEEGVKVEETSTDENGRYTFTDLRAGSYTISVIKKGYKPATSDAIIYEGSSCVIQNFELMKK